MKRYKFSTYPNDEFYERGEVDAEIAEWKTIAKRYHDGACMMTEDQYDQWKIDDALINKHCNGAKQVRKGG